MFLVYNELHVEEFINVGSGRSSNWRLKFSKGEGGFVRLQLHWGDKVEPTHVVTVPLNDLVKGLEILA